MKRNSVRGPRRWARSVVAVATLLAKFGWGGMTAAPARAAMVEYYVGRDLRETNPGTGTPGTTTYGGLPNPNFNRLTLLYNHGDHYHAKSPYTYVGPNSGATTAVQPFNGSGAGVPSNFLPENPTPPMPLLPGSGPFAGRLRTGLTPGAEFSDLRLRSVDTLAGFPAGSPETILHTSSAGRWQGSIAGSTLSLVLVSSTPGLALADTAGNPILTSPGASYALGNGATFDFTPVLHVPANAAAGTYSATFKLVDTSGTWAESGQYTINTSVPEPSAALAVGGLGGLALLRRRRSAAGPAAGRARA